MTRILNSMELHPIPARAMGMIAALLLAASAAGVTTALESDLISVGAGLNLTLGAASTSDSSTFDSTVGTQLSRGSGGKPGGGPEISSEAEVNSSAELGGGKSDVEANAGGQGEVGKGKRGGNGRPPGKGGAPVPELSTWMGLSSLLGLCVYIAARQRRK